MTNFNVVRQLHRVGTWDGESTQILLDSATMIAAHGQDGCAVIVQAANHGPIIAVAKFATAAIGG